MNSSAAGNGLVAVTGATGFIGRRLVQHLHSAQRPLRVLSRRAGGAFDAADGIETIRGDLHAGDALIRLVDGADTVVHLAGSVRGRIRADFDHANVHGTRGLLEACRDATRPPRRFVLVSSLAAREAHLSHYAASKRAGEDLLRQGDWPFSWIILRPTAVYGPGDTELAPLLTAMARGLAPAPGIAAARVTLVHVDDLVDAIVAASGSGLDGACLEISDAQPQGYSWADLGAAVSAISGRRSRIVALPRGLMSLLGGLNVGLAAITGHAPMLSPGKVNELYHPSWACDLSPALASLAWAPQVSLEAGLRSVLRAAPDA